MEHLKNYKSAFLIVLCALVTLVLIPIARSQSAKEIPNQAELFELSKTIVPLPEGDIRPLVALAATYGKAEGQFVGKVVAEMTQKMGSKVDIHVYAVLMAEQADGCPKVKVTIKDIEHPNVTSEAGVFEVKACPRN